MYLVQYNTLVTVYWVIHVRIRFSMAYCILKNFQQLNFAKKCAENYARVSIKLSNEETSEPKIHQEKLFFLNYSILVNENICDF